MSKQITIILLCLAIVVLMAGTGILSRTVNQQQQTLVALRREKAELDVLRAENEKWKALRVDAGELDSLHRENTDLLKLRNTAQQLREANQAQGMQESEMIRQLRDENAQLQQQKEALAELPSRAACIKNLELIDAAKKQWAAQNGMEKGDLVTLDALSAFFPEGIPVCPDGGHYTLNRVGTPPVCSMPGHSIADMETK